MHIAAMVHQPHWGVAGLRHRAQSSVALRTPQSTWGTTTGLGNPSVITPVMPIASSRYLAGVFHR